MPEDAEVYSMRWNSLVSTRRFETMRHHRCTVIDALLDANFRVRFFDLPGELRNAIYEYLLTSPKDDEGVITCYPQILATCEQVNEEATSILYGENKIEIRLAPDGVFANGIRCGEYQPTKISDGVLTKKALDFTTITWPDFLRRAYHLNVRTRDQGWRAIKSRNILPSGNSFAALSNTVYSLSTFLARDNEARNCKVAFHFPGNTHILGEDWWRARFHESLDPMRLLTDGRPGHDLHSDDAKYHGQFANWDEGLPEIMESLLVDGTSQIARWAFDWDFNLHFITKFLFRLVFFVPCLLLMRHCKRGYEKELAVFLCEFYGRAA